MAGSKTPVRDEAVEAIVARFETLPRLVAEDADLMRRGRFLSCDFEIGVSEVPLMVNIEKGRVLSVTRGPFLLRPWAFAVRAGADAWERFLEPYPAAGWHDLMALTKVGRAKVEGNLVPFMGNLQYVKDVLALPRLLAKTGAAR